jgi:hypothetical protein
LPPIDEADSSLPTLDSTRILTRAALREAALDSRRGGLNR